MLEVGFIPPSGSHVLRLYSLMHPFSK